MYRLEVKNLSKFFDVRSVLRDVSFSLEVGGSLALIGPNGSGKTTLLKIMAGLLAPTRGRVVFSGPDGLLNKDKVRELLSYVGPEMTLYDALTGEENLRFFAAMRGIGLTVEEIASRLEKVGLGGRGGDRYGAYSSGMKQRLKYAVALLNRPVFLLLDEPAANLDDDGRRIVSDIISCQKQSGILIIATNEEREYAGAERQYRLGG